MSPTSFDRVQKQYNIVHCGVYNGPNAISRFDRTM
jgi:hypothetical protein